MTCPGYTPAFGIGQLDGTQYAGLNCNCWSAGKAADDDTCGAKKPSASTIRTWTGDTFGGTTLGQVDQALREHVGVDLDTRYRLTWGEFVRLIDSGRSAILQGWYAPIRATRFSGSETFGGNHSVFVPPGWAVMDPLADGRRAGIYKYHGEPYPQSLLRTFAGKLNIGGTTYKALGDGLVYASFTRDNEPAYRASVHPLAGDTYRRFGLYTVVSGRVTETVVARTAGFSATCTAPRLYPWAGHTSQSLVKLTSGSRAGKYIRSSYAHEV